MEERLKVEVQISSYDAKGLQCFVSCLLYTSDAADD